MIRYLPVLVLATACGCSAPAPEAPQGAPAGRASSPAFTGRAWLATDDSAAPGTIRVFLPDGTLLMDSCFETYRLARWQSLDDRRVMWMEDSARIEAQIVGVSDTELHLRLQLRGEAKDESYRAAVSPFVCPDMPR